MAQFDWLTKKFLCCHRILLLKTMTKFTKSTKIQSRKPKHHHDTRGAREILHPKNPKKRVPRYKNPYLPSLTRSKIATLHQNAHMSDQAIASELHVSLDS